MVRLAVVEIENGPDLACCCDVSLAIHVGDACIVQCERALEYGRVASFEDREDGTVEDCGLPRLLRRATLQDQAREQEDALRSKMARDTCESKVRQLGLPMRLVRVRYSFDRKVLSVLFTAEDRVDFRELVRALASELGAHIEMRQIGVRDEAAIVGGLGPCGRQLCCCSWLSHFESINVKMAKSQNLSLNPGAINGMCGRLKCCLRYEYDQYRDLVRRVPKEGTVVRCAEGTGRVISRDILAQQVKVRLEDDRICDFAAADVERVDGPARKRKKRSPNENPAAERSESESARKP